MVIFCIRVRPRFFDQVGHQTTTQCCVLTNSSPLGVGQAPVENSWGTYKTKNVAQKKLA